MGRRIRSVVSRVIELAGELQECWVKRKVDEVGFRAAIREELEKLQRESLLVSECISYLATIEADLQNKINKLEILQRQYGEVEDEA